MFDRPLVARDGRRFDRVVAIANPRNPRTLLFQDTDGGGPYTIPSLKRRDYRLLDG